MSDFFSFGDHHRILHLIWFVFFLSFVVYFKFAPFATAVKAEFGLETGQIRTIAICEELLFSSLAHFISLMLGVAALLVANLDGFLLKLIFFYAM